MDISTNTAPITLAYTSANTMPDTVFDLICPTCHRPQWTGEHQCMTCPLCLDGVTPHAGTQCWDHPLYEAPVTAPEPVPAFDAYRWDTGTKLVWGVLLLAVLTAAVALGFTLGLHYAYDTRPVSYCASQTYADAALTQCLEPLTFGYVK